MADIRQLSHEETVQALDAKAKSAEAGDSFRLRIQRRHSPSTPPQIFALFEDANVAHFATPETWLPGLVGPNAGGIFELMAYHASNPILPVGGVIRIPIEGNIAPPNVEIVGAPAWSGPRKLSYPKPGENLVPGFSIPQQVGTGGDGARRDSLPQNPSAPTASSLPAAMSAAMQGDPQQAARLVAIEESIQRKQRDLDAAETRMREAQVKNEILGTVKAQMDGIVDLVRSQQQATQALMTKLAEGPKDSGMKDMVVALAPLVVGFIQQAGQAREDAAKRQEQMMMLMLNRPQIDPAMQQLLDRATAPKPDAGGQMMSQMAEAMASMTNVTMQLVHTAAEMGVGQSGPAPEPPWIKAVREGAKVVMAMMASQAEQAKAQAASLRYGGHPPPQQALPPHAAPAAPQAAPVAAAPPPPTGNGAAASPPAEVTPPPEPDTRTPIEKIEGAIRKKAPVDRIALAIINNVQDPSIVAAFMEAKGNIETMFHNKLGPWLTDADNAKYVENLIEAVNKLAQERGLIGNDDDEGEEEEVEAEEADA